jgi:hypothetical protein
VTKRSCPHIPCLVSLNFMVGNSIAGNLTENPGSDNNYFPRRARLDKG